MGIMGAIFLIILDSIASVLPSSGTPAIVVRGATSRTVRGQVSLRSVRGDVPERSVR